MTKDLSDESPIIFFPDYSNLRDREKCRLTRKEVSGLSKEEKRLITVMVDLYHSGSIRGIEEYSGGCMLPKNRIEEILKSHKPTAKLKPGNERFVFSMAMPSTSSEAFIERHKINLGAKPNNGMQQIAKHMAEVAKFVKGSDAFFDATTFGFTLHDAAAKAMHKVSMAMNPVSRGAGD